MEKLKNEAHYLGNGSYKYAFYFDRTRNERERGITIDGLKKKKLCTFDKQFSIIDAPGHRDFINNTVLSIFSSDAVLFVVPADKGGFEASVNREYGMAKTFCDILLGAQSNQIIVAINKMDAANYSSERFNEIKEEMKSLMIKRSFKKQFVEENVAFIPLSGWSGDNLVEKSEKMHWWDGCEVKKTNGKKVLCFTLLDILNDFIKIPKRKEKDVPLRVSINNFLKIRGIGDVVTGKCEQGVLKVGAEVAFLPSHTEFNNCSSKVFSIESFYVNIKNSFPGRNIAFNIMGLSRSNLPKKGDVVILKSDESLKVCNRFTASVRVLEHPGKLKAGYSPLLIIYNKKSRVKVLKINWKKKENSNEREINASFVESRDIAEIVFESSKPMAIDINCQPFSKMIIIDSSKPVMIGKITEIHPN